MIINDSKKLRVYLRNKLIDYKTYQYGEWKIQSIMLINFIS